MSNILPVFVPHGGCPNHCVFCNQKKITGRDDLPDAAYLKNLVPDWFPSNGELAYYGGSFTALPRELRLAYLEFGKELIEQRRISGIRISTHPACISPDIIEECKDYGVTTVELGIQSTDEEVLTRSGRCCSRSQIFEACSLLEASGLTWGIQLMIGLPGDNRLKALTSVKELIPYHPHLARIYPTLVIKDSPLAEMYRRGEYNPLSLDEAVDISADMYSLLTDNGVRVIRMGLQTTEEISRGGSGLVAGPFHDAFGYLVKCRLMLRRIEASLPRDFKPGDGLELKGNKHEIPLIYGYRGENKKYLERRYGPVHIRETAEE